MFNTCKSIVSMLVAISLAAMVTAQEAVTDSASAPPLWQGVNIETDVLPLITNFLNNESTFRYEAAARINLINKYYPVLEVGYEGQHTTMLSGIEYTASGLYYRLGIDFNLMKNKNEKDANNMFLVGARLGYSSFGYDMLGVKVRDEYAITNQLKNFTNLTNNNLWFEVVAGIRIEVVKRVTLGWTVRMKNQITQPESGALQPWSIPGYGISGGNVWAINYRIGYQF